MPICKSTEIENFSVRPNTFITALASNKNDPKSRRKNSFQQKLFVKFLIEITILVAWPFGQVSIIGTQGPFLQIRSEAEPISIGPIFQRKSTLLISINSCN